MGSRIFWCLTLSALFLCSCAQEDKSFNIPPNTWIKTVRDEEGARRHSSFRYVENEGYFLLWGYLGYNVYIRGGPHAPYEENPEYDIVVFDPKVGRWRNQFPFEKEQEWSRKLPPMYLCNFYHGITTGSYRPQLKMRDGVLRPDLNIVFDQVTFDSKRSRMIYFTGGRTFAYDLLRRQWSDIGSGQSPPPLLGGSLCYDPFNDEIILVGGGHVAERDAKGRMVGYTGTWIYKCERSEWEPLENETEPMPRMVSRLVCDTKNKLLIIFGGDAQSHYLADTWIYDTGSRTWRQSQAEGSPPPRAGHFTVYDPQTGWVIIGGGYNRENLTDMWGYDAAEDNWFKLKGEVPVGWYVTADIMPEESLIVLTSSTTPENYPRNCDKIYSLRTTYIFKAEKKGLVHKQTVPIRHEKMLKRSLIEAAQRTESSPERRKTQLQRIKNMLVNQWILLSDSLGRAAPLRSWGSCSFDTDNCRIIYWGGGHCGYGGSDYDFYDVEENTWITSPIISEYPERAWNRGINPAGVTFSGAPWMRHGRKIYAYDPASKKIVNMKYIVLTAGYNPEVLRDYHPQNPDFGEGENFTRPEYVKWVTWTYEPETEKWEIICSGAPGLDLTVTTPHGVMAVDYNWGAVNSRIRPDLVLFDGKPVAENAVFLLDVAEHRWEKVSSTGPWPQNLYEQTALVYDSKRDQLILHGAGNERNELWIFKISTGKWHKMNPTVAAPIGSKPPVCRREGVYLPGEDVFFTCGYASDETDNPGIYIYRIAENAWYRVNISPPLNHNIESITGQNRAITYDSRHNLVLMVLGGSWGDNGKGNLSDANVYALRYDHSKAELNE